MKKKWLICLLIALMFFYTGCSNETTDVEQVTEASDLKIAMLLPSSPSDGGWGQTGANALNNAKDTLGCEGVIVEAATADLMKSEAVALADEGFHIIFGHGGQYSAPFAEIASSYPDTIFITVGGSIVSENQMPVEYMAEQLTFIQGAMAAKLSESKVLGLTVGGEFPSYLKTSRGFELGAKSIEPDIKILFAVTQDSSDMNEAYEIATAQINAGADVIWSNANQASLGSIQAAKENGAYIFGNVLDQSAEAPNFVVASTVQDMSSFGITVCQRYLDGTLTGEVVRIAPETGDGLYWAWNEPVKASLPNDVVDLFDDQLAKIQSGEIHVPSENEGWE